MLSLQIFHKMKFTGGTEYENEIKKIYWIFYALIEEFNKQESINDNQDKQLAELRKQIVTKEEIIKMIAEHSR